MVSHSFSFARFISLSLFTRANISIFFFCCRSLHRSLDVYCVRSGVVWIFFYFHDPHEIIKRHRRLLWLRCWIMIDFSFSLPSLFSYSRPRKKLCLQLLFILPVRLWMARVQKKNMSKRNPEKVSGRYFAWWKGKHNEYMSDWNLSIFFSGACHLILSHPFNSSRVCTNAMSCVIDAMTSDDKKTAVTEAHRNETNACRSEIGEGRENNGMKFNLLLI